MFVSLIYFSANMNIKENELLTNVEVSYTGKISLFRAIITDITCDLQLDRFPYDQVSQLDILSPL